MIKNRYFIERSVFTKDCYLFENTATKYLTASNRVLEMNRLQGLQRHWQDYFVIIWFLLWTEVLEESGLKYF